MTVFIVVRQCKCWLGAVRVGGGSCSLSSVMLLPCDVKWDVQSEQFFFVVWQESGWQVMGSGARRKGRDQIWDFSIDQICDLSSCFIFFNK